MCLVFHLFRIRRRNMSHPSLLVLERKRRRWRAQKRQINCHWVSTDTAKWFICERTLKLLLYLWICFFSMMPRDWLRTTSAKWPILCQVGRETLTQSMNQSIWTLLVWAVQLKIQFSLRMLNSFFKHLKFVCLFEFCSKFENSRCGLWCCIVMATVWMAYHLGDLLPLLISGRERTTAAASRTLFGHSVGGPRHTRQ